MPSPTVTSNEMARTRRSRRVTGGPRTRTQRLAPSPDPPMEPPGSGGHALSSDNEGGVAAHVVVDVVDVTDGRVRLVVVPEQDPVEDHELRDPQGAEPDQ